MGLGGKHAWVGQAVAHVKIPQLEASLSSLRRHAICVRTVCPKWSACLDQFVDNSQTSLMEICDMLQGCPITTLIQTVQTQGCYNVVIAWLYQSCWNNIVPSVIIPTSLFQVFNSLLQTCSNNFEQAVRRQLINSLWTDLFQPCSIKNINQVWCSVSAERVPTVDLSFKAFFRVFPLVRLILQWRMSLGKLQRVWRGIFRNEKSDFWLLYTTITTMRSFTVLRNDFEVFFPNSRFSEIYLKKCF